MENIYDFSDTDIKGVDMIRMYMISMSNVGAAYERRIKTVASITADIGGTFYGILGFLVVIDFIFGVPFRQLDIAVSFRKLQQYKGPHLFCEESK